DLVELCDCLVRQALGQRREVEPLERGLSVGHQVAEIRLEGGALGVIGLLGIDDHPALIGDRVCAVALGIDGAEQEVVLDVDAVSLLGSMNLPPWFLTEANFRPEALASERST